MFKIFPFKRKLQSKDKEERVKLMIDEAAATELEALRVKYKSMVDENNSLSVKVQFFYCTGLHSSSCKVQYKMQK